MATIKMYYTGEEDFWCRKILKSKTGTTFHEVDGVPHHITADYGEPICGVKDYEIVESAKEL